MRRRTLLLSLLVSLPTLLLPAVRAAESGPEDLVRRITGEVLEAVKTDPQLAAGDRKKALALAEQKILPHVDFREATQLAVGKAWQTATPPQQERLVAEFRAMLVRIYSNAVDSYRGQTMRVMPLRMAANDTEVTVRNQYLRDGQPPVRVDYAMRRTAEGWKIYDITVEGVSLVLTYRAEFENVVRGEGVDGLIRRLQQKNA